MLRTLVEIAVAVLLTLCGPLPCLAADGQERSAAPHDFAVSARPAADITPTASDENSEVFVNVVVAAGKNVSLDSKLDYSSASTVAVTVQCTICTSQADSLAAAGLVLQARWIVPNASSFAATENKSASAFSYWDSGGVLFNVYGPQFRLNLQNKGSQGLEIAQLTIFRRAK